MTIQTCSLQLTKDEFFYSFKEQTTNVVHAAFLESGRGGNYSIAAWNPKVIVKSVEQGIELKWNDGCIEYRQGESLFLLEQLLNEYKTETISSLPDFQGGAIGFISYDYARKIERLPELAKDTLNVPDLYFYLFTEWAIHDVKTDDVTLMKRSESEIDLDEWASAWKAAADASRTKRLFYAGKAIDVVNDENELQISFSNEAFQQAVRQIQEYISAGDVFQVNLSVQQAKKLNAPPITMYEAVRSFNPSPYMSFIKSDLFTVVSGSPELLIKRTGKELSTRPIAGTRPRGKTEQEDYELASELINNIKERAEHVMLVDLERNDLGRVSRYGTVEVDEFMVIERYSHVMHIVSNVRGELAEGKTNTDVIRAMFPGGTITGAPKIRTMEIIEELEPVRRGLYTGSIGWIGFNGDMELNIVIRTAFVQEGMAYIQAGAGIVIDSIPANEFVESLNKAKAMWQAKAMAEAKVR
jgi:para-aminobenzoate synthetase component I